MLGVTNSYLIIYTGADASYNIFYSFHTGLLILDSMQNAKLQIIFYLRGEHKEALLNTIHLLFAPQEQNASISYKTLEGVNISGEQCYTSIITQLCIMHNRKEQRKCHYFTKTCSKVLYLDPLLRSILQHFLSYPHINFLGYKFI